MTLDLALLREITNAEPTFDDPGDESYCAQLVEALTEEERETAARTSFCYWSQSVIGPDPPSSQIRKNAAMKEVKRHYVGSGRDYDKALESIKFVCNYRQEEKIDLIKACFSDNKVMFNLSEEDLANVAHREALLEQEIERQHMCVRGLDKEGRAIIHRESRNTAEIDKEGYVLLSLYFAERGYAITEVMSRGKQDEVISVLDYSEFTRDKIPSSAMIKESLTIQRQLYPCRAKVVFVLDPPMWLQLGFAVISPFVGDSKLTCIVSGNRQKQKKIAPLIDDKYATTKMLSTGKLTPEVDFDRLLHKVPFHKHYDQ